MTADLSRPYDVDCPTCEAKAGERCRAHTRPHMQSVHNSRWEASPKLGLR